MGNISFGKLGENIAAEYLIRNGYKILYRNFRSKFGEIDLVTKINETICFVEVKTRKSNIKGEPYEAITARKVLHLQKAVYSFLLKYPQYHIKLRIDAVSILFDIKKSEYIIKHFENIDLVV